MSQLLVEILPHLLLKKLFYDYYGDHSPATVPSAVLELATGTEPENNLSIYTDRSVSWLCCCTDARFSNAIKAKAFGNNL